MALNVDFASTFLELAGVDIPDGVQGRSLLPLLRGDVGDDWPISMYYRYWMHGDEWHNFPAHYGVRTLTHKLIVIHISSFYRAMKFLQDFSVKFK